MRIPRRPLVALAVTAVAASMALAPSAGSVAPQERQAGTSGAKTYHRLAQAKKSDYVKLDLLALNDFHGNLRAAHGQQRQHPGHHQRDGHQGRRRGLPGQRCSRRSARSRAPRAPRR